MQRDGDRFLAPQQDVLSIFFLKILLGLLNERKETERTGRLLRRVCDATPPLLLRLRLRETLLLRLVDILVLHRIGNSIPAELNGNRNEAEQHDTKSTTIR